jgi:hypothetical protein
MTRCSRGSLARDSVALFMRTTLRERTLLCKRNIAPTIITMGSRVADVAAVRAADTGSTRNSSNTMTSFLKRKLGRRF